MYYSKLYCIQRKESIAILYTVQYTVRSTVCILHTVQVYSTVYCIYTRNVVLWKKVDTGCRFFGIELLKIYLIVIDINVSNFENRKN